MGELPLKLLGLRKKAKHSTTVALPPIVPQTKPSKDVLENSRILETTLAFEMRKLDKTSTTKHKLASTLDMSRSLPVLEASKLPPKPTVVKHGTLSFVI